MPSENRDWSVPAPLRTLLWWPAIAFVLVVVAPDASVSLIIGTGLVLAVLGALLGATQRRLARATPAPTGGEVTIEFPTMDMPRITDERAA